jgi:uncharacterized protein with HEPN domain
MLDNESKYKITITTAEIKDMRETVNYTWMSHTRNDIFKDLIHSRHNFTVQNQLIYHVDRTELDRLLKQIQNYKTHVSCLDLQHIL